MTEARLGDRDDPGGGLRQKLTHFTIQKRFRRKPSSLMGSISSER